MAWPNRTSYTAVRCSRWCYPSCAPRLAPTSPPTVGDQRLSFGSALIGGALADGRLGPTRGPCFDPIYRCRPCRCRASTLAQSSVHRNGKRSPDIGDEQAGIELVDGLLRLLKPPGLIPH